MHYCIGDVHGCFDALMDMIGQIEARDSEPSFILLGDLVDRGPKVWETLQWAMSHIKEGGKYQCIMGNHEVGVLEWYRYKFLDWQNDEATGACKGTVMPRSKFDFSKVITEHGLDEEAKLLPVIEFLDQLPYQIELELESSLDQCRGKELGRDVTTCDLTTYDAMMESHKIMFKIVHAWYMKNVKLESMQQQINVRRRCLRGNADDSFIIVHGHTPTNTADVMATNEGHDRPGMICYRKNAINLDGGCCFGEVNGYVGKLCGICLETGEEYYAEQKLPGDGR